MKLKTEELIFHPLSTKYTKDNVEDLMRSIPIMGQLQPIIINRKKEVLKGNRRLTALQLLKIKTVEVIIIDFEVSDTLIFLQLRKTKKRTCQDLLQYFALVKKLFGLGQGCRTDLFTSTYTSRSSVEKEVREMTGYSKETMRRLIIVSKNDPDLMIQIDDGDLTINGAWKRVDKKLKKEKALSTTPIINIKKPLEINDSKLYPKSCENMNEVDDESVQLIFTSPPYFSKRVYRKDKGLGNERTPSEYIKNLYNIFQECYRVLRNDGSLYLNIADTRIDGSLGMIPEQLITKMISEGDWKLKHKIIWKKTNPIICSSPKTMTNGYEYIYHLVKSDNCKFNKLMVPSVDTEDGLKGMSDFVNDQIIESAVSNQSALKDLDIDYHPAPFPEKICYFPILCSTDPGDIVLDPFNGSGTTGVVADKLGRKYIGYDDNQNFIHQSFQRLSKLSKVA